MKKRVLAVALVAAAILGSFGFYQIQKQRMEQYIFNHCLVPQWNDDLSTMMLQLTYTLMEVEKTTHYSSTCVEAERWAERFSDAGKYCVAYCDAKQLYLFARTLDGGAYHITDESRANAIAGWTSVSWGFSGLIAKLQRLEEQGLTANNSSEVANYLCAVNEKMGQLRDMLDEASLPEQIKSEEEVVAYLRFFELLAPFGAEFEETLTTPLDVSVRGRLVVVDPSKVTALSASKESITLIPNQATFLFITATFDGCSFDVTHEAEWTESDRSVVQAVDGFVTGGEYGEATITVSYGGQSLTIPVEVIPEPPNYPCAPD